MLQVPKDHQALQGQSLGVEMEQLDLVDYQAPLVLLEEWATMVLLEVLELQDLLDQLVELVPPAQQVLQEQLVKGVLMEEQEHQVDKDKFIHSKDEMV